MEHHSGSQQSTPEASGMSALFSECLGATGAALSPQTWVLLLTFLVLLGWYSVSPFGIFERLGIPGPRPVPFLGTFLHYRKGIFKFDEECYKKYGNIWGIYDGRRPLLCIMDPDLIKIIFIKEFYTLFTNRRGFGLSGPLEDSIIIVTDEQWKKLRTVLSPMFTSGRMKEIFSIINHYTQNLVKMAEKKAKLNEAVNLKEVFGSYSMDVVASTSFSLDIDSINNPDDPLVTNVKIFTDFSFFSLDLLLILIFPFFIPILQKLNWGFFPKGVTEFFIRAVLNMKAKRQKGIHNDQVDFLQLLVDSQATATNADQQNDANNSTHNALTDKEILAQCIFFILAGYETISNTLSYLGYNLAMHPDVQKNLPSRLHESFPMKAPPTYDDVMQLEYLEMVISETLRLHPAVVRLERVCKKDIKINGVTIPKNTVVVVPAYVLHHDPKYWQEPEEFRPERFSKEERQSQNPSIFLPFGMGPRKCVGMRFAQLMIKMSIVSLLQHLTFVPCNETPIPLELDVKGPKRPKKPIILKFVSRVDADSKE
ncbi:cytochrome P450 3A30-like [Pristis pectinata]|uniref:cytochrome P450 3A30-like n=1 Tax=Pristis pectinata TaxID=685728 RepID=UPI00223E85FB|nr:cytochrome P450 3A30-like [Pristis pectinata]